MSPWQNVIRWFEIRALQSTNAQFHILLFVVYLFNKRFQWFSWQALIVLTSKTWVRAPGLHYSSYYFSNKVHMPFHLLRTMIHFQIKHDTSLSRSIQRHRMEERHKLRSTLLHASGKGQTDQCLVGLGFLKDTSYLGTTTPPGLQFSLYFIFFQLLFYSLYCFI